MIIHWTILATTFPAPTYTPYDIVDSLYSVLYVAIIPIFVGASAVFGAWWIWTATKAALKK